MLIAVSFWQRTLCSFTCVERRWPTAWVCCRRGQNPPKSTLEAVLRTASLPFRHGCPWLLGVASRPSPFSLFLSSVVCLAGLMQALGKVSGLHLRHFTSHLRMQESDRGSWRWLGQKPECGIAVGLRGMNSTWVAMEPKPS